MTIVSNVNAPTVDMRWFATVAGAIRAAVENARRWGAIGTFRLASRLLRRATLLHRQHRISA